MAAALAAIPEGRDMLRNAMGYWVFPSRSARMILLGTAVGVMILAATRRSGLAETPPAKLPDGALSGIIVPVEIDPAAPKKAQLKKTNPEQAQRKRVTATVNDSSEDDKTDIVAVHPAPAAPLAPELLSEELSRAKAIPPADVRPSSFQGLTPGSTPRTTVLEKLGDPIRTQSGPNENETILSFKVGPFPSVDVTLSDNIVTSIMVHLAAPGSRSDVVQQLKLGNFKPTPVPDDAGQTLGEVYPERALTLVYTAGSDVRDDPTVSDIVLEKITPEPFLLRAQQQVELRFSSCLSDLEMVHQLAPNNAFAYYLEAQIHANCGHVHTALAAVREALKNDPDSVQYQLMLAELQRRVARFDVAQQLVKRILEADDLSPLDEAAAHLEQGKLLVTIPPHAYKKAMNATVSAVKQLSALTKNPPAGVARVDAQRLLIDAELWLARIIAYGPWEKRSAVAPQWLASAEKTTRKYIQENNVPKTWLLRVYLTSLECLDTLEGEGDPAKLSDAAITLGRHLITVADDDDSRAAIEWQLGIALRHAAEVAYRHGKIDAALRYANNSHALLSSAAKQRTDAPDTDYQLAQIEFLTGSIYAVGKNDHASAVTWYEQAVPILEKPLPPMLRDERARIGDQLVSIGVSFWQEGRKGEAVAITEQGADRLRQAIEAGLRSKRALVVPLSNLADMHKALGHKEKAEELAQMAASLTPRKVKRTIR